MSVLRDVMLGWLGRVARSSHRDRLVLRGSLLTSAWCPGRAAADVDHLVLGGFQQAEARAIVEELISLPDDDVTFDPSTLAHVVIWAETPSPGLRSKVIGRTRSGAEALLQVDLGQGDALAVAPVPVSIDGVGPVLGVSPETMFAWKTDGLFEFGHGSWRAKDLYDLWLIDRNVTLDHDALVVTVRAAFQSQKMELSVADRFLFTELWGASRGSRRRWESFGRKQGITESLPEIARAIGAVRTRLLPVFAALGHSRPASHALQVPLRDDEKSPQQKAGDEREPRE